MDGARRYNLSGISDILMKKFEQDCIISEEANFF